MTASEQMLALVEGSKNLRRLCREYETESVTVHLKELVGGAFSLYAAATIRRTGGVHVFVAEDRDAAAYLLNDLYALLDERRILFFPSSYKRSIVYGAEDAQGVVQRTAALNALRTPPAGYLALCTYPEALAERVVDAEALRRETMTVRAGDHLRPADLVEWLDESGFVRVDFVYEPGQYSQRGGIVDVFSYVESLPYRFDFFDEEVDSIRRFNISSQLSQDKLQQAEIIPNLNAREGGRVSLVEAAGDVCYWFFDADYALRRVDDLRRRMLAEADDPAGVDRALTSRRQLLDALAGKRLFAARDTLAERPATVAVEFRTAPQPSFNKNFELLADDLSAATQKGYRTYILSENKAQVERLQNIFHQVGRGGVVFTPVSLTLHEGFVDHTLRLCCYTDHQLFDRYQRYRINGEIRRDEQMTVAELNQLKPGDYVVHIDHGVGRFGGLVKINENGRMHEAIKLVYRDGDVLFVNVHSLHRISRYKSGDGEPPKVYKLGSGAWQKLKAATKKAVKDISRELIALYAKRKASQGFAFSADGYLQHELEASFRYEETPDQQAAIEAVKRDMESAEPMDRLVCGDVGFGKTEVAIRAAFKAACDGKQTAVLVPTTILALQHYRSFMERLRDFPVKIEYLNRTKSARETKQILADLEAGRIDILIGTHKMLGKNVRFHDLGLLVIDEEQKFGVAAKEKLTQLSVNVDTLTLTATPIPRTLQFSLMGSRDLSVISTPPPNRQPIVTESHVFSEEIVRDAVEAELARGGQVYFVHNRVEDLQTVAGLITRVCPKARVGVGHGKMPAEQLERLQYDHRRRRPELRSERPASAARPCGEVGSQGLLLPVVAARRTARQRCTAASACHRGVLRLGVGVQHRHAGPRHPRRRQPAGGRAEWIHRRHRVRDLSEDHARSGGRTAGRGTRRGGAERPRAGGRRAVALCGGCGRRGRRRGRAARLLREPDGRKTAALPRARRDAQRGGVATVRAAARRSFRGAAAGGQGAARRGASALGGGASGHGAREGQERVDDRTLRGRRGVALLQERGLLGAVAPRDPTAR